MSEGDKEGRYSSVVEHVVGNDEVEGSIPSGGTIHTPMVAALFWSKVDVRQERFYSNYCWEWQAGYFRDGYGQFKPHSGSNPQRAPRIAWELWHGRAIPEGLCILHSCDNPKCCNPKHLRPGTHKQNGEDKAKRGRTWKGGPRKKDAA